MANKGIFITLEGGEGVGKTTQAQRIESYFYQNEQKSNSLKRTRGNEDRRKSSRNY